MVGIKGTAKLFKAFGRRFCRSMYTFDRLDGDTATT